MKERFDLSDPQLDQQRQMLFAGLDGVSEQAGQLTQAGQYRQAAEVQLTGLTDVRDRAYTLARTLAVEAVADHTLSRAEVARTLGTDPHTVGKWVKSFENNPDRDYTRPLSAVLHLVRGRSHRKDKNPR